MATKKVTYLGSQLAEVDETLINFQCDSENGLILIQDPDALSDDSTYAFAAKSHHVTDTNNPIWNEVNYKIKRSVTASDQYEGHVTLVGLKPDGTSDEIMEHVYTGTLSLTEQRKFQLLGSACAGETYSRVQGGATTSGTVDVNLPLPFDKYEEISLMPSWYNESWSTRNAIQFDKSSPGNLQGSKGRKTDSYVFMVPITYASAMNADFSDIRFTAQDGITELPHHLVRYTASTDAVFLVSIPYYILTLEPEKYATNALPTDVKQTYTEPTFIYFYYGNSAATDVSDVTLNGTMAFYDEFDTTSIDTTKWPTTSASGVSQSGGLLTITSAASVTSTPYVVSQSLPFKFNTTQAYDVVFDIESCAPVGATPTTATDGYILRLYATESDYFEVANFWYTGGYYSATTDGKYLTYHSTVAGAGGTWYNTHYSGTSVKRFVKASIIPNYASPYTAPMIVWHTSKDGKNWDIIGHQTISTGALTYNPTIRIYYLGQAAVTVTKNVVLNGIYVYPTLNSGTEYFTDHFRNATYGDRWQVDVATGQTITESGNTQVISAASTNCFWAGATCNAPRTYCTARGGRSTMGGLAETVIYETRIDTLSAPSAGYYHAGGIWLGGGLTQASDEYVLLEVIQANTSGTYTAYVSAKAMANGADTLNQRVSPNFHSSTSGYAGGSIWLRIMLEKGERRIHFQYSLDGKQWLTGYSHPINVAPNIMNTYLDAESYMGLYVRSANYAGSPNFTFGYFRAAAPPFSTRATMIPVAEEYLSSYPLTGVADSTAPNKAVFTLPSTMPRNAPLKLSVKKAGDGDYSTSKISYVTVNDLISIGPDGLDKYIGMRLEFDFKVGATDTVQIEEINYLYEVI